MYLRCVHHALTMPRLLRDPKMLAIFLYSPIDWIFPRPRLYFLRCSYIFLGCSYISLSPDRREHLRRSCADLARILRGYCSQICPKNGRAGGFCLCTQGLFTFWSSAVASLSFQKSDFTLCMLIFADFGQLQLKTKALLDASDKNARHASGTTAPCAKCRAPCAKTAVGQRYKLLHSSTK